MTLISEMVANRPNHLSTKWKQVQSIANMYWNRCLKEYISTLTPRLKWTRQTRNFKIADLVIVKSEYIPRNHWPLGRAIKTFAGSDNIIRSVKVKTPSTELVRPSNSYAYWKPRMHIRETGPVYGGGRMFRHILLIKDNSVFINYL